MFKKIFLASLLHKHEIQNCKKLYKSNFIPYNFRPFLIDEFDPLAPLACLRNFRGFANGELLKLNTRELVKLNTCSELYMKKFLISNHLAHTLRPRKVLKAKVLKEKLLNSNYH